MAIRLVNFPGLSQIKALCRGVGSNFWLGGEEPDCTDAMQHQQFWLILQNVLHIGNIQMVQLKYFKVPLPKEIFVTTSILSFPDLVWV